jgi:hypothetical protein
VDSEIVKLNATVATGFAGSGGFAGSVDLAQAEARDLQGIGGPAASVTAGSRTAST